MGQDLVKQPFRARLLNSACNLQWWREEDSNLRSSQGAADLQSAAINHSAISPIENQISSSFDVMAFWSWRRDLNPRPADYKSAALPTELRQPVGKTRNLAETLGIRNREFCTFDKIWAAGLHVPPRRAGPNLRGHYLGRTCLQMLD